MESVGTWLVETVKRLLSANRWAVNEECNMYCTFFYRR